MDTFPSEVLLEIFEKVILAETSRCSGTTTLERLRRLIALSCVCCNWHRLLQESNRFWRDSIARDGDPLSHASLIGDEEVFYGWSIEGQHLRSCIWKSRARHFALIDLPFSKLV